MSALTPVTVPKKTVNQPFRLGGRARRDLRASQERLRWRTVTATLAPWLEGAMAPCLAPWHRGPSVVLLWTFFGPSLDDFGVKTGYS